MVLDRAVILAGSHFYTSGAFWGVAAGVIVGVLGIAATVWVTLRAANPKRRLYYTMVADTPLVTRRHDLSEELKVTYGARELKSPHVVTVQLASRGRRDIAREAFDDGKPVCFDLGTPIIECVKVTTSPPDRPDPAWTADGARLLIGPSHFGKRQTTVFALLIDGETPHIAPPQQALVDVQIEHGDGETSARTVAAFPVAAWILLASGIGWMTASGSTPGRLPRIAVSVALLAFLVTHVIATVMRLKRSNRSLES